MGLSVYIRKPKERKSRRFYESFRLVESVRIENKPRQRTILNLGADFSVPLERHKELCDLIKERLFLINLTQVESSFKSMKSELGIRPIHQQKERRGRPNNSHSKE